MDDIFDTILKLYGKPGIDTSYLPKLIRNKATGEVRRGYGEPDSSLEEVCWEFKVGKSVVTFPNLCQTVRSASVWNHIEFSLTCIVTPTRH
jgi:hypothetical protein